MYPKSYKIIGVMSGTSLDGLDLSLCEFKTENEVTTFEVLNTETISYQPIWKDNLREIYKDSAENYFKLHGLFGAFIGEQINSFLHKNNQTTVYIASHGHTIFHQPASGFTSQIGCGATIAATTGIATISDFRSLDVALKGQGAPLVPIGDRDLFRDYESCLNMGGIANISFHKNHKTEAFDICIANMALNYLSETIDLPFDKHGKMASTGVVEEQLLKQFLNLHTAHQSIGREWFESHFLPILNNSLIALNHKMATCVEYIAIQIADVLLKNQLQSVFITGGGVYHLHLIERLKFHYNGKIHIPSDEIIQFKEAIIFAYLGYLRIHEHVNTLSSVTKAVKDSVGGCVYLGNNYKIKNN